MIPVIKTDTPTYQKTNILHLIVKQKRFLNNITTAVTYNLQDIDYLSPSLQTMMRKMIMTTETIENPTSLILSFDYSEFSSGYIITFLTYLESEAHNCIMQLPSFLHCSIRINDGLCS